METGIPDTRYPSIETVFVRDKATNKLDPSRLRNTAHSVIRDWVITEKIDGMNIRVTYTKDSMIIGGRSDNAQIPADLVATIQNIMPQRSDVIRVVTDDAPAVRDDFLITFYGEGYGGSIQKQSAIYGKDKQFRCFDARIGSTVGWLNLMDWATLTMNLGIPTVDTIASVSRIPDSREALQAITKSIEGYEPEGVVARPTEVLFDKRGDRVMWKLCYRDL